MFDKAPWVSTYTTLYLPTSGALASGKGVWDNSFCVLTYIRPCTIFTSYTWFCNNWQQSLVSLFTDINKNSVKTGRSVWMRSNLESSGRLSCVQAEVKMMPRTDQCHSTITEVLDIAKFQWTTFEEERQRGREGDDSHDEGDSLCTLWIRT